MPLSSYKIRFPLAILRFLIRFKNITTSNGSRYTNQSINNIRNEFTYSLKNIDVRKGVRISDSICLNTNEEVLWRLRDAPDLQPPGGFDEPKVRIKTVNVDLDPEGDELID